MFMLAHDAVCVVNRQYSTFDLRKESFDHRNYFFYRVQIDLRATILWVLEPYPFPRYEQHALFPFHDVRDVSFFLRPAHPCCR